MRGEDDAAAAERETIEQIKEASSLERAAEADDLDAVADAIAKARAERRSGLEWEHTGKTQGKHREHTGKTQRQLVYRYVFDYRARYGN